MPRHFKDRAATALYLAVKDHVRHLVRTGALKVGDRLPSEHTLVADLGVSRMTVHRAMRELAEEGFLERVTGVGTFVARPKAVSNLLHVGNLADEIVARGHRHQCRVLQQQAVAATPAVAAALGLPEGAMVFQVVCVHEENGLPIQWEDRFVSPAAAPRFLDQAFGDLQPGEYLLRTVPLDEVEHTVDAIAAPAELAEGLRIQPGDPCLVLTRRTWNRGQAVTLVRCIHPAARYRLSTRFKPGGSLSVG